MGRTIEEVIDALPHDSRKRVGTRYHELKQEVEGLRQLRKVAGKAQTDIAAALKITQPSVSKLERQADMYLSTLRSYVQAVGGELELVIHLPSGPALHLHRLCDILPKTAPKRQPRARRTQTRT